MSGDDFNQGTRLAGAILASGRIATAAQDTTIYTVPAASVVKIATATLCNTGAVVASVNVSVVPSGGAIDGTHKVVHNYPLDPGDTMSINEIVGAYLDPGAFVSVRVDQPAALTYLLTGVVAL